MKPGDKIKFTTVNKYDLHSTFRGVLLGYTTKIIKVEFSQHSIALEPTEEFKWKDITKLEVII